MLKIRNIIAVYILLISLPIALAILNLSSKLTFNYYDLQDEISIRQLRRIILLSYDLEFDEKELSFIYHNKNFRLSNINNNLVLSEGYQLIIPKVDEYEFYLEGNILKLKYERDKHIYEKTLSQYPGIYLTDLFDNHDDSDLDSDKLPISSSEES